MCTASLTILATGAIFASLLGNGELIGRCYWLMLGTIKHPPAFGLDAVRCAVGVVRTIDCDI